MSVNHERLDRPRVTEIDELLGLPFKVLDDGFIRVVDYMGSDESIVQAARVSYGRGTKKIHEDRGLIRYLMRHRHTTPFEMCEIKLHVRVPMDCWRQWIRHRTANVNEYSTRYSVAIDGAQKTPPSEWRSQSAGNRQGSAGPLDPLVGERLTTREMEFHQLARAVYDERLASDVAREQARKDLPLSTYTEAYWKIDLHNLFNFLALRMDAHAQLEIRSYANIIGYEIVKKWCPFAWEAFESYQLNALRFSQTEMKIVRAIATSSQEAATVMAREAGLLPAEGEPLKTNRERVELEEKLKVLGFSVPWLTAKQETP